MKPNDSLAWKYAVRPKLECESLQLPSKMDRLVVHCGAGSCSHVRSILNTVPGIGLHQLSLNPFVCSHSYVWCNVQIQFVETFKTVANQKQEELMCYSVVLRCIILIIVLRLNTGWACTFSPKLARRESAYQIKYIFLILTVNLSKPSCQALHLIYSVPNPAR